MLLIIVFTKRFRSGNNEATARRNLDGEPGWCRTESITASAPSITALATSETSARVGRGFFTIDSSIWVAQITGVPARLHFWIIIFWATNTCTAQPAKHDVRRAQQRAMTPHGQASTVYM